jgi:hypothetical protein
MVDELYIPICNRTMKPFSITQSGVGGSMGKDGEGYLTNVQYKSIWNCHNEYSCIMNTS